jgi:hypothetical protein
MSEPLFRYITRVVLDAPAIATGHVVTKMAWEDGPNGKRRPGTTPEVDEHGRHGNVVDVLMPLGRDGQPVVVGVTVWGPQFEVPQVSALQPIEFEELRVSVRQHTSGKGVEVSFTADGIAAPGRSTGRRAASAENSEAA